MPEVIAQSVTKRVPLKVYLADGVSDATGKTIAVIISKNAAAFGNPSAGATNATEIASGWYYADLSTTDTGTLGPLIVRGTGTGCDNSETVYTVAASDKTGFSLTVAEENAIADAILGRNVAGGSSGGRMVSDALRFLRNKWSISGATLTVYQEDDATIAWQATLTGTGGTNPVTTVDPA